MKKGVLFCAITISANFGVLLSANAEDWPLPTTLGEDSAYSITGSGEQNFSDPANYTININTNNIAGEHTTLSFDNSGNTATGSMILKMPEGDRTLYYTYTQPSNYETVETPQNTTDLLNKTFSIDPYAEMVAAIGGVSNSSLVITSDFVAKPSDGEYGSSYGILNPIIAGVEGDFIGNYIVSASTNGANGPAISLSSIGRRIGYIKGDFINNYARSKRTAEGGAIYNSSFNTIGSITGNFIGNHINDIDDYIVNGSLGKGGAISNNANIGDITGNFVGNYIWTIFPQAYGGAIVNHVSGVIGDITGDFIGNWVYAKGTTPRDQGNGDVYGGAIYADSGSTFGKIKGDFIGNYVSGTTNNVQGGAIWSKTGNFDGIESNFIGNYAYAANSTNVAGGAIYTVTDTTFPTITGSFLGNYVYGKQVYGGAIANRSDMTLENSTLKDNYAKATSGTAKGGAIWSLKTMNLKSKDNHNFEIAGNYIETSSGRKNEAIYIDYQTTSKGYVYGVLNIDATNGGRFTIRDNINGGKSYKFFNTGDGTGKVDMYGFIDGTSVFKTNDIDFHYHQMDDILTTTNFVSMNIDSDTSHFYYYIDVDPTSLTADKIKATASSTGYVTLNGINLMEADWDSLNEDFIVQVLDVKTDDIQLALSDELKAQTNQNVSAETPFSNTDTVKANTKWTDVFKSRSGTKVTTRGLGLAKTKTTNDSIGFSTREEIKNPTETILGDTLAMVAADTTNPTKTFTASNPNAVYVLGSFYNVDGVGTVKGNLTVSGTVNGNKRSTIDLNHKKGFKLANTSANLTLQNVAITNANSADYGAVDNEGILNVKNVSFTSNTGPYSGGAIKQSTAGGRINYIRDSYFTANQATSGGGAIAVGTLIEEITNSYFNNNSASTAGGAISLECGEIGNITNTSFTGNNSSWGGAFYIGTKATLGGMTGSAFYNNSASLGGALYYNGNIGASATSIIGSITNTSFVNNTASVKGGAIYSTNDIHIAANNGSSTFFGNYVGTADNNQAIYMDNSSSTLSLSAINSGVINMNDYVTGEQGYSTVLSGNNKGRINLYNNILNSVVTTSGAVTINTGNSDLFTYNLLTLNSSADTKYIIDINITQKMADLFETSLLSSGTVTLAGFNIISGNFSNVTDPEFKIQVIKNNDLNSTLKLALDTELADHEFVINREVLASSSDAIQVDTDWEDIYNSNEDTQLTYGTLGLAKTTTEDDSIGIVITRTENDPTETPLGDTLVLVSQADLEERNFNTQSADSVYTLSENIGETAEGVVTINGTEEDGNRSTLDMNSNSGFNLDKETTINLNNVEVINTSGTFINATNSDAEVNLTNVNLTQNQSTDAVIVGGANVNITADASTSSFASNAANNVIYMNNADLNLNAQNEGLVVFDDDISGNGYNVNILGDDSGEVRFNNHVTSVDQFTFDEGAIAALGVNSRIKADSMSQVMGAENSTLVVDINVNKAAKTTSAGLIELLGELSGDYNVIVNPANDDIYDGAYALFLKAPNDTDSSNESFTVTRVYGNPYLWEAKRNIKTGDVGSMWYLALSGTIPSDTTPSDVVPPAPSDTTPSDVVPPTPSDTTPSDVVPPTPSDTTPSQVVPVDIKPKPTPRPVITPEVIAGIGLHEAALEQNRSVVRNVKGKVDANRYYCNNCHISYDRYWRGRQLNDLWILAQGENANVDAPVEMEAKIYDVEAGFDLQSDIHNTLGIFVSYRRGDYDFNGKGEKFSSPIGSTIDIDSWLAGLYYRYDRNMNWAFATVYGGIQKADIKTDDGVAKFDTDGKQFGASLEVGHSFLLKKNLVLDPSLGVFYTQVNFDDATDNVGKQYSWDDIKQLQVELGAKLERQYFRGDVYVKPSVIRTVTNGDSVFITGIGDVDDTYKDQTLFRVEIGGRYNFNTATYGYAWANYTVGSDYDAIAAGLGLNYAW